MARQTQRLPPIVRGDTDDHAAWVWARGQQGYEGTWADWQAMPLSERQEYERGAAGDGQARRVVAR